MLQGGRPAEVGLGRERGTVRMDLGTGWGAWGSDRAGERLGWSMYGWTGLGTGGLGERGMGRFGRDRVR